MTESAVPGDIITLTTVHHAHEKKAKRRKGKVGEQQLKLCGSLISATRDLVKRQVDQEPVLKNDKIVEVAQSFRHMVGKLQELARKHADLDCLQQLHRSEDGMVEGYSSVLSQL